MLFYIAVGVYVQWDEVAFVEVEGKSRDFLKFGEKFGEDGAFTPYVFGDNGGVVGIRTDDAVRAVVLDVIGQDLGDDSVEHG